MTLRTAWVGAALAAALAPAAAPAQDPGAAVRGVDAGTVLLGYAAQPDVEVCRSGVRRGDRRVTWRGGWDDDERSRDCRAGWIDLELEVRDGTVRALHVRLVGEPLPDGEVVDLGEVPPEEVVGLLADLVRGGGPRSAAEDAVFPMVLADVDDVWRPLLEIARDRAVPEDARTSALFWLGQEAADASTRGLAEVARDDDEAQEVRDAAVFALSQRPADEGVPVLMELARTAEHAGTRRTALFWLAQSGDERALGLFEEILLGTR